jgi:ribosomal-protein-alanine N-acetyltransferase
VLSSPRLMLRSLTAHDAEHWLSGADRRTFTFPEDYPSPFATELLRLVALYPITDEEVDEYGSDLGPWLVEHDREGVIIGTVSCARTVDPTEVSVGYDIAPSYWGQGYATEALSTAVEHLLSVPDVQRVCADTTVEHLASRRVMEKAGLRWQRDEFDEHDGRKVKFAHYAIDRPEPI